MRPVLTKIAATSPDFIYYPIFIAEGAHITTQAKEVAGLEDTILSGWMPPKRVTPRRWAGHVSRT